MKSLAFGTLLLLLASPYSTQSQSLMPDKACQLLTSQEVVKMPGWSRLDKTVRAELGDYSEVPLFFTIITRL